MTIAPIVKPLAPKAFCRSASGIAREAIPSAIEPATAQNVVDHSPVISTHWS
ncbi:hypothetical protein [Gordonia rubripertincta]|uniref:hypothetical protein n=1 Tax=Gordonia rubripertincta TaxID=36822 RepID=UPI0021B0B465|nr:hypothetical protein [Gordonia rubripertincta]